MFDIQSWFEEIGIHWEVVFYCMVRGTLSSLIFNQILLISSIKNYITTIITTIIIYLYLISSLKGMIHINDRFFSCFQILVYSKIQ